MPDHTRSSRRMPSAIDGHVQGAGAAPGRQWQPPERGGGRVREPRRLGHDLRVRPRAVRDRGERNREGDDAVERVPDIRSAEAIGRHPEAQGFGSREGLAADSSRGRFGLSCHTLKFPRREISTGQCAILVRFFSNWGDREGVAPSWPRSGPGGATRRASSRRSSGSQGRWGTSRGRARASISCRTRRARVCP